MSSTGQRRRWNVGVVKIPHAERDVARAVLGERGEARGFFDILGADTPDNHPVFPVGSHCAYSVDLTDDEADRFRAASNCRYVTPEERRDRPASAANVPEPHSRAWLRQDFTGNEDWHGRNVNMAILDSGTTPALRSYMGYTLVAWGYTNTADPPPTQTTYSAEHNHGSLCSSAAIPAGGRLLDCNIVDADEISSPAWEAAGIRWAVDHGATFINISFEGDNSNNRMAPVQDAINYMGGFDAVLFCAAGNGASSTITYPAAFAFTYPHVHAVMSFSESTGQLAPTSNYTTNPAAGVAPGETILGVTAAGIESQWHGTSAASPFAASCGVRMLTKATYTAKQASTALKQNLRDLGLTYQGGGGYDMQAALDALGAFDEPLIAASGRAWLGFW